MSQHTLAEIALRLKRSPSTISRELRRNGTGGEYLAGAAHEKACRRRRERPLVRKCDRPAVDKTVRRLLACRCSPAEIAGRMQHERRDRPEDCVSGSTIYRWINRQGKNRGHWRGFLRRRGRRPYKPRENTADAAKARVADRPAVIERRGRIGDFEGDLVLGKPGSGGLKTLVDRKSRYTLLMKVVRKNAAYVHRKTRERLKTLPPDKRHSITYDNGGEFARCRLLEGSLNIKVYWAKPGCPYQRGTNENTNGLARQFFPKGTDFHTVTHEQARNVENLLNHRPRACLNYRTPYEVFYNASEQLCCD
jgi:IS30 family transposase